MVLPICVRVTSLAIWRLCHYPIASDTTLKTLDFGLGNDRNRWSGYGTTKNGRTESHIAYFCESCFVNLCCRYWSWGIDGGWCSVHMAQYNKWCVCEITARHRHNYASWPIRRLTNSLVSHRYCPACDLISTLVIMKYHHSLYITDISSLIYCVHQPYLFITDDALIISKCFLY